MDTYVDTHEPIVGQEVENIVDGVELGALRGHVLAPEIHTVPVQSQVVVELEAATEQRLNVGHVLGDYVKAVSLVGQQGDVVGNGPRTTTLVGHHLAHAKLSVVIGGDEVLLQVAHRQ